MRLIGKLCLQYECHPEATGRMVDTACAVLLLGKRKLPPPRLTSMYSIALTVTPTRHCSSKRRSSKESASAGSFTSAGVLNSKEATEAHRQVDGHPSRSLLDLPRPSSLLAPHCR